MDQSGDLSEWNEYGHNYKELFNDDQMALIYHVSVMVLVLSNLDINGKTYYVVWCFTINKNSKFK